MPWTRWRRGPAEEERRIFTEHVRALAAGEDPAGHLQEVWAALRTALRSELKRRGLWDAPPSYLGVHGEDKWESGGGRFGTEGPLEELLAECYAYVFVARLSGLAAQLKVKPNIDGLVFLNIRHFLHERQREHDPIGAHVFTVLQAAVRLAVEEGELRVLQGDEKVRNDTVLGFGMATEVGGPESRLAAIAAGWNDELLPDLVTLRGRRQEEVVLRLRELLRELSQEGVEVFRFKDLVDPLKADARARWAALLAEEQGDTVKDTDAEGGEVVRVVRPNTRIEERQLFRKLVDCVLAALARLDVNERTRGYLSTLWQFLRFQAAEGIEPEPASRLERSLAAELESLAEERPSRRRIAEQLQIPRERLADLYRTLGELFEECRALVAGPALRESRPR
jgi:hypothetical protein